jgi:hypothetical protein
MDDDTIDINFDSGRDRALDVALSTREKLQSALNSAKHGVSTAFGRGPPLTIRDLLYGNMSDMKTVTVHDDTTKYIVLFKWYSMSTVYLKDITTDVSIAGNIIVHLDSMKMNLYVIDIEDVATGICMHNKDIVDVYPSGTDENNFSLMFMHSPPDILNRVIRRTSLDCHNGDWEIYGETGTIFTVFRGNKFTNVMTHADATLSSSPDVTASYMGKVNSVILYRKYINDINSDIYLANIFCSKDVGCNTYSNMNISSPIKRLSIRDQVSTLVSSTINNITDDLTSPESRLMIGLNISK